MKNLFTILLLTVFAFNSNAQTDESSVFYAGVSFGVTTLNNTEETAAGNHFGLGAGFGLNTGFRLNERWGFTANLGSSANAFDENNELDAEEYMFSIATLSVGPMISFQLGDNIMWDIKPQISLLTNGKQSGDATELPETALTYNILGTEFDGSTSDKWTLSGPAWVFGNSFVFNVGKGIAFSLDVDYVMARFNKLEDPIFDGIVSEVDSALEEYDYYLDVPEQDFELDFNSLRLGLGVRYNF